VVRERGKYVLQNASEVRYNKGAERWTEKIEEERCGIDVTKQVRHTPRRATPSRTPLLPFFGKIGEALEFFSQSHRSERRKEEKWAGEVIRAKPNFVVRDYTTLIKSLRKREKKRPSVVHA
jgi:hypothetical protein